MEKIIAVVLLFLLIGFGGTDIFDDHFEDTDIEEDKIVAQEEVSARGEAGESVHREFEEIGGGAEVDITTDRGDIMAIFNGRIAGNATVDLISQSGDITVRLDDGIYGAAKLNIATAGDVYFINDRDEIAEFIDSGHITIENEGDIIYNR